MSGSTYKNKNADIKSSKNVDDMKQGIGQGELYSPHHALKINPKNNQQPQNNNNNNNNNNTTTTRNHVTEKDHHHHHNQDHHHQEVNNKGNNNNNNSMVGKGVANEIKNKMSMVKERLMEKLAAASVPSDALENARQYCEAVIKDVTSAAQGLTKEALQRIKSHLADLLPSLSPSLTSKMVDDSEKEATKRETAENGSNEIEGENYEEHKGKAYASPASSLFSNYLLKPPSKL